MSKDNIEEKNNSVTEEDSQIQQEGQDLEQLTDSETDLMEIKPEKTDITPVSKDKKPTEIVEFDQDKDDKKEKVEDFITEEKDDTQKQTGERGWYVIHTYAGYEEQVAENLQQRIDTLKMSDKIFDVIVPKEKQIEIKNGKRKIVEKRIFPGYVIVDMIVTDNSWYVVRNTPNVTGFIGLGVRPTPMSSDEIVRIKKRMGVEEPKYKVDLKIDDLVRINDGPLKGFEGKITEVDEAKGKIKVAVNMFGRETPVNLDFLQVKKV